MGVLDDVRKVRMTIKKSPFEIKEKSSISEATQHQRCLKSRCSDIMLTGSSFVSHNEIY